MPHPVRRSLLLALTALIGVSLMAILFAVSHAARRDIEDKGREEALVAARVFDTMLADRNQQLAGHATLLARDLRFRQAIATQAITGNNQAVVDLLLEHQRSSGADLSLLVDNRGLITSNAPPGILSSTTVRQLRSGEFNQMDVTVVVDGKPFQLVFAPVKTANWIAWVGMGYVVDAAFLENLEKVTGMRTSMLVQQNHGPVELLSTLPDSVLGLFRTDGDLLPNSVKFIQELRNNDWLTVARNVLDTPEAKLQFLFSTSVAEEMSDYQALRGQLLILALLVLFLATAVAVWVSGRADRHIRHLALAAHRIARGDYSKNVALADTRQLTSLEEAFNAMQLAIEEREHHFSFQAQHDPLTGVANRHHLDAWVKTRFSETAPAEDAALVVFQICGLNHLTDVYGPEISDQLVIAAARRAESLLGSRDKLARFESDEFFMYLEGIRGSAASSLVRKLDRHFRRPFKIADRQLNLEVHFGIALCPEHGCRYPDLLRRSNIALSQTFVNRSRVELYRSGQDAMHLRKIQITHSLRNALDQGHLQLRFQPQYCFRARAVQRAEVLLRWEDEHLGTILPSEFIPLAEQSGQITIVTRWLVDRVLEQLADWESQNIELDLSINISAQDLLKGAFVDYLTGHVEDRRLRRSALVLEITEGAVIEHPDMAITNLRRLHDFGIKVAMDDFGTGFSSLSQLKALPLHELKIDKSFILNLDRDEDDRNIVRAAIEMAHSLGLEVVAEGVENRSALGILETMGCDLIQGNLIGKPMSAEALETWLTSSASGFLKSSG